jgi:hypothetical protein
MPQRYDFPNRHSSRPLISQQFSIIIPLGAGCVKGVGTQRSALCQRLCTMCNLRRNGDLRIMQVVMVGASEWTGVAKPQAATCRGMASYPLHKEWRTFLTASRHSSSLLVSLTERRCSIRMAGRPRFSLSALRSSATFYPLPEFRFSHIDPVRRRFKSCVTNCSAS